MDFDVIQREILMIKKSEFARKTDRQLISYQELSDLYRFRMQGAQPPALARFNQPMYRKCKLTIDQVRSIRQKYNPHVYGKQRLAVEYGVSKAVIDRILKGQSWKVE